MKTNRSNVNELAATRAYHSLIRVHYKSAHIKGLLQRALRPRTSPSTRNFRPHRRTPFEKILSRHGFEFPAKVTVDSNIEVKVDRRVDVKKVYEQLVYEARQYDTATPQQSHQFVQC